MINRPGGGAGDVDHWGTWLQVADGAATTGVQWDQTGDLSECLLGAPPGFSCVFFLFLPFCMFKLVGCRWASRQSGSGAITKWGAEGEGLSHPNKAGPPPPLAGASTPGSARLGHTGEGGLGRSLSPAHPDFP